MPAKSVLSEDDKKTIRKKLIELCEDFWIKSGYKKTNIRELCKATNISIGTFYILFSTKEQLFFETIQSIHARLAEEFIEEITKSQTKEGFAKAMKKLGREYAQKPLLYTPDFEPLLSANDVQEFQLSSVYFFRDIIQQSKLKLKIDEEQAFAVCSVLLSTLHAKDTISSFYNFFLVYDFMVEHLVDSIFV